MALRVEPVAKSLGEMAGEFCRELAVLVLVFVPLELYRASGVSRWVIWGAIAGSISLLGIGMAVEVLREKE